MKWFRMTRDDNKTVTLPLIEGADVVEITSQPNPYFTLDSTPVNFPKNTPIFLGKLIDNVQYVDYSDNFKTALSQHFKLLDFNFFKNHKSYVKEHPILPSAVPYLSEKHVDRSFFCLSLIRSGRIWQREYTFRTAL